jgi:hypothetical protein
MKRVGHETCTEKMRNAYKILVGNPGKRHLGETGVNDRIVLKWILK